MNNFEYCVPTRVIFGRDTQKRAGELIKEYGFRKVMIHYGGGSVKRSGLLVQANPTLSKALEGMEICRR